MAITSSSIADIGTQRDGRRWVRELHTDQVGMQYVRNYLAGAIDDLDAALAVYAAQLTDNITASEIATNVSQILGNGSLAVLTFTYSTAGQNRDALRSAYQTAIRVEAIMIGDFLSSLTDGQLQSAFGMTGGQVTTLRANKLTPAASAATGIRAATGQ